MINLQSIIKILESQGKFDFKPFVIDGVDKELWAYRNQYDWLEICDSDLKVIDESELKLGNPFFVFCTDKEYRLLKRGTLVSELRKDYPPNIKYEILVIPKYYPIIKLEKEINGYSIVLGRDSEELRFSEYLVFEPQEIYINKQMNCDEFWRPEKKYVCYDIENGKINETDIYYCGTINLKFSHNACLFYKNDEFWFDDCGVYTRRIKFKKPVIKKSDFGYSVLDVKKEESNYKLSIYRLYAGCTKPAFDFLECDCLGVHPIGLEKETEDIKYYTSNQICLICFEWIGGWGSKKQLWATFDWNGTLYYQKKNNVNDSKIVAFTNCVVKSYSQSSEQYNYVDYRGNHLASVRNSIPIEKYVLITRNIDTTLLGDETNSKPNDDNIISLKGIMDTRTCEMKVPLNYRDLSLYCDFDNFYAIISEVFTGSDGNRQMQYGLIYNGEVVLPCNYKKLRALTNNIFVFEDYNKYGVVSNGIKRSKCIYDSLSLISEISEYKSEEDEYGWSHIIPFKYKHALTHQGDKVGICSPKLNLFLEPQFNNVSFIDEQFFLADNLLYKVVDDEAAVIRNLEDFHYLGGINKYHLFVRDGEDIYDEDSYLGLLLLKSDCFDDTSIINLKYTDDYKNNELDEGINNGDIDMDEYAPILCVDSIYYSIKKNEFTTNLKDFTFQHEEDYYDDDPDDTDYDRETFYALGGDDYDHFKENGGSIDDMMDGMGL
jgi:hypothetical protein